MALNKPKDILVKNVDGEEKTFIISRIPAIPMREVMAKYPISNIPKLGEYTASAEVMQVLMQYVGVYLGDPSEGKVLALTTAALINNHVSDGEQLLRIEYAMLEYNTSFFGNAGPSTFLKGLIEEYLPSIIRTVTASLPASVPRDLRAKPNSKQA